MEICAFVVCMRTPVQDTAVVGASSWGVMEIVETQDPHTSSNVCAGWALDSRTPSWTECCEC